jgi:predicted glycoside hydrolase/deacetylase ChbG (UPF0249 family)
VTRKKVEDAVIFPKSNLVVDKDPLDYTIFTKNPGALQAPMDKVKEATIPKTLSIKFDELQPYIQQIVSAISEQNKVVQVNVNLDELSSVFQRAVLEMKQYASKPISVQFTGLDVVAQQMVSAIKELKNREESIKTEDLSSYIKQISSFVRERNTEPVILDSTRIEDLLSLYTQQISSFVRERNTEPVVIDTSKIENISVYLQQAVSAIREKSTEPVIFDTSNIQNLSLYLQQAVSAIREKSTEPVMLDSSKIEELIKKIQISSEAQKERTFSIDTRGVEATIQKLVDQINKSSEPIVTVRFEDISFAIDKM